MSDDAREVHPQGDAAHRDALGSESIHIGVSTDRTIAESSNRDVTDLGAIASTGDQAGSIGGPVTDYVETDERHARMGTASQGGTAGDDTGVAPRREPRVVEDGAAIGATGDEIDDAPSGGTNRTR